MLRLLSPKIFREGPSEYALPMVAFEDFEDVLKIWDLYNGTYKFLLPVSKGEFAEVNIPACFSKDPDELRKFYEVQKKENKRSAFIISDFLVTDLEDICYSGIINTVRTIRKSKVRSEFEENTTIRLTYKNPIITYAEEGISPRDLKADVKIEYDRISDKEHSFPKIINNSNKSIKDCRDIIVQAFDASKKIHDTSLAYDGDTYNEYTLFYVDSNNKIHLYEIIGEESFIKKAKKMKDIVGEELDMIKKTEPIKKYVLK